MEESGNISETTEPPLITETIEREEAKAEEKVVETEANGKVEPKPQKGRMLCRQMWKLQKTFRKL